MIFMESVLDSPKFYKALATKGDVQALRHELRDEIKSSEMRILKWVIGTIITQTGLIIAVIGIAVAILLK